MTTWDLAQEAPAGLNLLHQQFHHIRSHQIQVETKSSFHLQEGSSLHLALELGQKWIIMSTISILCKVLRNQNWLKIWIILTCQVTLLKEKKVHRSNSRMMGICSCTRWAVRTQTRAALKSNPSSSAKTQWKVLLNSSSKTVLMTLIHPLGET